MSTTGVHHRGVKSSDPRLRVLAAQMGQLVNDWSGRDDLTVRVVHEPASNLPAPAYYEPPLVAGGAGEITMNLGALNVQDDLAEDMQIRTAYDVMANAAVVGVLMHEAGHAAYTRLSFDELNALPANVRKVVVGFEETRMERRVCRTFGVAAPLLLRASATEIIVTAIDEQVTCFEQMPRAAAAQALLLTSARIDAGSLKLRDCEAVEGVVSEVLTQDDFDKLRALWLKAQRCADDDVQGMAELAREWLAIVGAPEEAPTPETGDGESGEGSGEGGEPGESTPGEGKGEPSDDEAEGKGSARDDGPDESGKADDGAGDKPEKSILDKLREAAAEDARIAADDAVEEADEEATHGAGEGGHMAHVAERTPAPADWKLAKMLADAFRKVMRPERIVTEKRSEIPPGKLLARAAVQRAAQRSQGVQPTAQPWRSHHRKPAPTPPTTIGVMVDVSGSMSSKMRMAAALAWALPKGAETFGADTALVYFGDDVVPGLKRGEKPKFVREVDADGGTEVFAAGWRWLNGELRLAGPGAVAGHRVLVVISDCHMVGVGEAQAMRDTFALCKREGVRVIVVGTDRARAEHYLRGTFPDSMIDSNDPLVVAAEIAQVLQRG